MTRRVKDVMTRTVVAAGETASFKEMARVMRARAVSALPVVDRAGVLVGIVSEADLLLKEEFASDKRGALFQTGRRRLDRSKAAGLVAAQLMTTPVVTASPDMSLPVVARLMHERRIKRLPVVDRDGRVVGIVSRCDVLRIFLRPDEEIRCDVLDRWKEALPWFDPTRIEATVRDGVLRLQGTVEQLSTAQVLVALASSVEGVVGVDDRLQSEVDDLHTPRGMYPWDAGTVLRPDGMPTRG
jgi:CBS-domain-containing membrane protein